MMGKYTKRPTCAKRPQPQMKIAEALPYLTMPLDQIKAMPIAEIAAESCHLWLWTTNAFLRSGFEVMEAWGFKYLAPIHWIKPTGCGNYVIHRTQTLLLGYKGKCRFHGKRYFPNIIETIAARPRRHSEKPQNSYELIEQVSPEPRLELFARTKRLGWHSWGNEVISDVEVLAAPDITQQVSL
jgi:N6-adenosine-specific RNA methylase IME4